LKAKETARIKARFRKLKEDTNRRKWKIDCVERNERKY
jgi:hypothetical protein